MINQAYFSKSIKFFQKAFCQRWGVRPYNNPNEPAIFNGIYRPEDVAAINNHKGFKVIWQPGRVRPLINQVDKSAVARICPNSKSEWVHQPTQWNDYYFTAFKTKYANYPIKDFSMFTPVELGDKVYIYLGNESGKHVMGFDLAQQIKKRCGHDVIYGMQGNSIEWIQENYYKQSFVNIKISVNGAYTTATEMAYMGRVTIGNGVGSFIHNYKDIDDLLRLIDVESKKIGTIQTSQIGAFFETGSEWKNVDFWL